MATAASVGRPMPQSADDFNEILDLPIEFFDKEGKTQKTTLYQAVSLDVVKGLKSRVLAKTQYHFTKKSIDSREITSDYRELRSQYDLLVFLVGQIKAVEIEFQSMRPLFSETLSKPLTQRTVMGLKDVDRVIAHLSTFSKGVEEFFFTKGKEHATLFDDLEVFRRMIPEQKV